MTELNKIRSELGDLDGVVDVVEHDGHTLAEYDPFHTSPQGIRETIEQIDGVLTSQQAFLLQDEEAAEAGAEDGNSIVGFAVA